MYQRQGPFQTLWGSTDRLFSTMAMVAGPQNGGSLCVRNCSARGKYALRSITDLRLARSGLSPDGVDAISQSIAEHHVHSAGG